MKSEYVVVTAISSFRIRYVMHKDDLRALNTEIDPSDSQLVEWAKDTVTCEEVEEFSQMHLAENIIDSELIDEDRMLELFDSDNDYLSKWERDKKIAFVRKQMKPQNYDGMQTPFGKSEPMVDLDFHSDQPY
jgi:hypothetical protein